MMIKICKKCGKEFIFDKNQVGKPRKFCSEKCYKEYHTHYRREYKRSGQYKRGQKKRSITNKIKSLVVYGLKCEECNEDNLSLLEFHHKIRHLRKTGKREQNQHLIARILRKGSKLKNVQLLCANCHILADIRDGTSTRGKLATVINQYKYLLKNSERDINITIEAILQDMKERGI